VPFWTLVGLVVAAWFVVAVLVGLAIGAMIRRRDRQTAVDRRSDPGPGPLPDDAGPDEVA
jgi:hypothetical protein